MVAPAEDMAGDPGKHVRPAFTAAISIWLLVVGWLVMLVVVVVISVMMVEVIAAAKDLARDAGEHITPAFTPVLLGLCWLRWYVD